MDLLQFEPLSATEYCIQAKVHFEYSPRTKDPPNGFRDQSGAVIKRIHGYLNHVGGVLKLTNASAECCSVDVIDVWLRYLIAKMLKTGIPHSLIHSRILFHEDDDVLYVLVKKSPELVTFDYGMFSRGPGAEKKVVDDIKTCYQIMSQPRLRNMPKSKALLESFRNDLRGMKVGSKVNWSETQSREYKMFLASNVKADKIEQKLKSDLSCLSGLPNLVEGGDYCLGINEIEDETRDRKRRLSKKGVKQYKVEGYELSLKDRKAIEKTVQSIFASLKTPTGEQLIEGSDWWLEFIPLAHDENMDIDDDTVATAGESTSAEKKEDIYLVVCHVNHVPGGVFIKEPVCLIKTEHIGSVTDLRFENWVQTVKDEVKIQEAVVRKQRIVFPLDEEAAAIFDVDQTDIELTSEELSYASVTTLKPRLVKQFADIVHQKDIDLSRVIPFMIDGNFCPPREVLMQFQPDIQTALILITTELVRDEKYVAFAYQRSSDETSDHVCDLLLLPEMRDVALVTIVRGQHDDQIRYFHDARSTCRKLKEEIISTYEKYISRAEASQIYFCLKPYVCNLKKHGYPSSVEICDEQTIHECVSWYFSPAFEGRKKTFAMKLRRALVMHMRDRLTSANVKLIQKELQYMTEEQIMSLLQTCPNRITLILGPPGSGNLTMTSFLCNYFRGQALKDRVMFITSHPGMKSMMDHHQSCSTYLVTNDLEMDAAEREIMESTDLICVIVADVANMPTVDWNRFYMTICTKKCYLKLLGDPPLQNYHHSDIKTTAETTLDQFCLDHHISYTRKCLTEVFRNSLMIASYMKQNVDGDSELIRPRSTSMGDDIVIRYTKDLTVDNAENGIVSYVKSILKIGPTNPSSRYTHMDAAIIVGGCDSLAAEQWATFYLRLFRNHLPEINAQPARYPIKGIVIDTVENFAALDSSLVIFVAPDEQAMNRVLNYTKYRIYIASRAMLKLVYLLPSPITAIIAEKMAMANKVQANTTNE